LTRVEYINAYLTCQGLLRHKNNTDILSLDIGTFGAPIHFLAICCFKLDLVFRTTVGNYTDKKMVVKGFFKEFCKFVEIGAFLPDFGP